MANNNTYGNDETGTAAFDAKVSGSGSTSKTGYSAKGQGVADMARDAGDKVADMARDAGDKIAETAQQVRQRVSQQADAAARATAETLESNPFGAVAGAIAIGAVAAALIPATRRELEALSPIADRVKGLVEEAYHAAREAGSSELKAAGLTNVGTTSGFGGVISALIKTATTAAGAAATSMRENVGGGADNVGSGHSGMTGATSTAGMGAGMPRKISVAGTEGGMSGDVGPAGGDMAPVQS